LIYRICLHIDLCCDVFNHWWIIRLFFLDFEFVSLGSFQGCSKVWHWLRWRLRVLGRLWRLFLLVLLRWRLVEEILVYFWSHLLLL
jgi:hypothetical protein